MSQRESGYKRKKLDAYETPEWVTLALVPHIPKRVKTVLEPACGSGKMVRALKKAGPSFSITMSDVVFGKDFLKRSSISHDAIITNPPYELATEFIGHVICLTASRGFVAMLLRTDFDHAKGRKPLFSDCAAFSKKLVLTKRIKWFEDSDGQPSFNHAWFIWDWKHQGAPVLAYHHEHEKSA